MATDILDNVSASWAWTGLRPAKLIAINAFGNLIIEAEDGEYWRICPEELSCESVAESKADFDALLVTEDFQRDWEMTRMVQIAYAEWGAPPEGRCYCLKVPGLLGGAYEADNIGIMWIGDLISFSGDLALQIEDLPAGTKAKVSIIG